MHGIAEILGLAAIAAVGVVLQRRRREVGAIDVLLWVGLVTAVAAIAVSFLEHAAFEAFGLGALAPMVVVSRVAALLAPMAAAAVLIARSRSLVRAPAGRSAALATALAASGFAVALSLAGIACVILGSLREDSGLVLHHLGELRAMFPEVLAPIAAAPALAWFGIRLDARASIPLLALIGGALWLAG